MEGTLSATDTSQSGHLRAMSSDFAARVLAIPQTPTDSLVPPPPPSSDVCVVPQAVEVRSARSIHDRARAFRAMYEQQVDFVWRNLRRLGVAMGEADDKAQEVFVIAHRRFGDFEDRGHGPRAWLFQIVLRVASDARRHRRRHPEEPDGGDSLQTQSVEASQADDVARREAIGRLDRALQTIDVGRRAVLVLHEIEEMTAPQIAEILGIPLNTVYSRLRVARGELESALSTSAGGER